MFMFFRKKKVLYQVGMAWYVCVSEWELACGSSLSSKTIMCFGIGTYMYKEGDKWEIGV